MLHFQSNERRNVPRILEVHDSFYIFEGHLVVPEKKPSILKRIKRRMCK